MIKPINSLVKQLDLRNENIGQFETPYEELEPIIKNADVLMGRIHKNMNKIQAEREKISLITENMVEGMEALSYKALPDDAGNAMSLVAAADYEVRFREGYEPADPDSFFDGIKTFLDQEEIVIVKKTKKGEREVNIRPQIYRMETRPDHVIFLQIATGSAANLKPDAVLRAYAESRGETLGEFALMVTRLEVYADKGTEESHQFVTLDSFGEDIE